MMARSLLALSLVMSPLALVRGFMPAATAPLARLRAPGMRAQAATIRMMADGKAEVSDGCNVSGMDGRDGLGCGMVCDVSCLPKMWV
jgi:hypothetical protein